MASCAAAAAAEEVAGARISGSFLSPAQVIDCEETTLALCDFAKSWQLPSKCFFPLLTVQPYFIFLLFIAPHFGERTSL